MKIGIDGRVLMDRNYSGISLYTANLFKALINHNHNNSYHLFYNCYRKSISLATWQDLGCQVVKTSYPSKIFNYGMQNILRWPKLNKVLGGVDIFFAPHLNFIELGDGEKMIITVHDLSFLRHPEFFSWRKNFWHRSLNVKKLLKKANTIVAVSESTKNDLQELLQIDESKIQVIYPGNSYEMEAKHRVANSDLVTENAESDKIFLQKHNIKQPFVLFLGNIEPRKNIVGLIEAFNILRLNNANSANLQLILAGGLGWKTNKIMQTWRLSPFKNDIKFLNYVSTDEKEILYRQALMFVYPSFYEGFGFPPLEAASFGLPVISSHVSSLPEVLAEAAILVDPFSANEIAEAMSLLFNDKELRSTLIARGLERASHFSWQESANAYLNLFEKINANK